MPDRLQESGEERKPQELPRGAYSQIARRVRPTVSPTAVRLVALGKSTSKRISAAIARWKKEHGVAA